MPENKPTTQVETISVEEMDNLLGMPGADLAMIADENKPKPAETKPTFFQTKKVDMSFIDDDTRSPEEIEAEAAAKAEAEANLTEEEKALAAKLAAEEAAAKSNPSFDDLLQEEEEEEEESNTKSGRKPLDKVGMAQLVEILIKDKVILPFEGEEKKLEEYTTEDYKELIQMNFDNQKDKVKAETPKEFFASLPAELQYAAQYVNDGGRDLKGLFAHLAAAEETKALTIDTESGQERAVRQFLQASNFGTDEEIAEQIDSWKDLDKLGDKAKQFKPKLDAMSEQIVQRKVKEQELMRKQREEQSQQYADNIYKTLEKGEIANVKINSKVQNMLYQGLIQPNYQSVSGQPTNLFGHLIEKHQYVEPNHGLIAEALWLLADPDGYRKEISKSATKASVEETARKLKLEQSNKASGGGDDDYEDNNKKKTTTGLKREPKNFFKR